MENFAIINLMVIVFSPHYKLELLFTTKTCKELYIVLIAFFSNLFKRESKFHHCMTFYILSLHKLVITAHYS